VKKLFPLKQVYFS